MKKIISIACCLVPFGVNAAIMPADYPINWDPGTGKSVGGTIQVGTDTYILTGVSASVGEDVVIQSGNGLVIENGIDGHSQGLVIANNMYIGVNNAGGSFGDFYATSTIDSTFTITSDGNITVGDASDMDTGLLQIASGKNLEIQSGIPTAPIDVHFNSVSANGKLTADNIDEFRVVGTVDAFAGVDLNATTLTTGAFNVSGDENSTLTADIVNLVHLINNGGNGNVVVNAGTMISGDIQNKTDISQNGGNMNVNLGGDLTVSGSIYNSTDLMAFDKAEAATNTADVVVSGTVKNDSNSSTIRFNVDSLRIEGGDSVNPSFVNTGNLYITVDGQTYLEYGFDLSGMNVNTNVFNLETGTLAFGNLITADTLLQLFENDLASFTLKVNGGDLDIGKIINGINNSNANMSITATEITTDSVQNNATLSIRAINENGNGIVISGNINAQTAGANTEIISANVLTVNGSAYNSGTMELSGKQVTVNNLDNSGTILNVLGANTDGGKVTVSGNVTNVAGETYINAQDISVAGLINNKGGVITLTGSDKQGSDLQLGGIFLEDGVTNINALIGGVDLTAGLDVKNGSSLNIDGATYRFTVANAVNIAGDFTVSDTPATVAGTGDVNVLASGVQGFVLKTGASINIGGDVSTVSGTAARSATFDSAVIEIGGNVTAANQGNLIFGGSNANSLTVGGTLLAQNGGEIDVFANYVKIATLNATGGKITLHGSMLDITNNMTVSSGLFFTDAVATPSSGLVITDTDNLTVNSNGDIYLAGDIEIDSGKTLNLNSGTNLSVNNLSGVDDFNVNGILNIDVQNQVNFLRPVNVNGANAELNIGKENEPIVKMVLNDVTNTGTVKLYANNVTSQAISNNAGTFIMNGLNIDTGAIGVSDGTLNIVAQNYLETGAILLTGGQTNITTPTVTATTVTVNGDIAHSTGVVAGNMLNLINVTDVNANSLTVNGNLNALDNSVMYNVANTAKFDALAVADGAYLLVNADTVNSASVNIDNGGELKLSADYVTADVLSNAGKLTIKSGVSLNIDEYTSNTGQTILQGNSIVASGAIATNGAIYQKYAGTLYSGDINIESSSYTMTAATVDAGKIEQYSGKMVINTGNLDVNGNITASDLRIAAHPIANWLNVNVNGNITGGVDFINLANMTINGNYTFNDNSYLSAAILPYATAGSINTTTTNYWSMVSLDEDGNFGKIINADENSGALVNVTGKFVTDLTLNNGQSVTGDAGVGIVLRDIVDQGSAIWLLHAEQGISKIDLTSYIRNLDVKFCNDDGSICVDYLNGGTVYNATDSNLPVYLSERDIDGDGVVDSLYIVFDPRFGGPVEIFKIQPIVGRVDGHTNGEYISAGALDNLVAAQIQNKGFNNRVIEDVIPVIFQGTNMSIFANELYNRMEQYVITRDGAPLAAFSRLFETRELDQILNSIFMNEHANFRSFEDRMYNEFIWHRNRKLKNLWSEFDFGMFGISSGEHRRASGERFNLSVGVDWQESNTLIFGLMARVSHSSANDNENIDLGYIPGKSVSGQMDLTVTDTNVGAGGYVLKNLGDKTRFYANLFADLHLLDVTRDQSFISSITGNATAFSVASEWGLMHDWLNQYIVGNMYARVGYNSGFSFTEQAAGQDYMNLETDGYVMLTPGYSLTAQKRIYPSAWLQIRPYASVGVEYDVLGTSGNAKYKFAIANDYTEYAVNTDELWINAGAGFEVAAVNGAHFGLDYRYQYNDAVRLHNIKFSASYRF